LKPGNSKRFCASIVRVFGPASFFSRTGRDDPVRVDRYGFGVGLRRIHCVDDGVDDDRVGDERRSFSLNRKVHKAQNEQQYRNEQGCGFHQR
jgi:hypothetical protein